MHTDKLQWVDEEYKAELKATLKPNENQEALAEMLEGPTGGDYHLLLTFTFMPNEYEEITQTVGEEFKRNMKVSWLEGEKIVKRVGRDGQMLKGTRGISPGWGARGRESRIEFRFERPAVEEDTVVHVCGRFEVQTVCARSYVGG